MDHDHKLDRKHDHSKDWRELCREVATEPDPVKLTNLVFELTRALNERDKMGQGMGGQENKTATSLQRELLA